MKKIYKSPSNKGQSSLFLVMMFSLIIVGATYYIFDRNLDVKKGVVQAMGRSQAVEALESVAHELAFAYTSKSCDPGLMFSHPLFASLTTVNFVNAAVIPPGQTTGRLVFRGKMVGFNAPDQPQLYASPAEYADQKKYYQIFIQRMWTLEDTTLTATNPLMSYPNSQGNRLMAVVPLSQARSAALNTTFQAFGGSATPLGVRDVAIELATFYPPLTQISASQFLLPRTRIALTVVLHNTCSKASTLTTANAPLLPVLSDAAGVVGPFSNLGIPRCRTGTPGGDPASRLGSDYFSRSAGIPDNSEHRAVSQMSLEKVRRFVEEGFDDSYNTANFLNCADINRDGIANEMDVGLMLKLMSGYITTIPPIWPGYHAETDPNHALQ